MRQANYDKLPFVKVESVNKSCTVGWTNIIDQITAKTKSINKKKLVVVIECYHGVIDDEILQQLQENLGHTLWVNSKNAFKNEDAIREMVHPDVTDDSVFGYLTRFSMIDYFDHQKLQNTQNQINNLSEGIVIIYGSGAALIAPENDLLVYADMARWEIQMRMRKNEVDNLGISNREDSFSKQYKQAYFVDWRVCDRLKKQLLHKCDFILDTNKKNEPKLVEGKSVMQALEMAASRPFRVVPFFDPGPWGGQWLKEVCDLDRSEINFAWGFDCVPEENSLLLGYGDTLVEIPSLNLVFYKPNELLGENVHSRFGDEFPIRFDFLDTMDGGNLSLQVHPLTEYIQEKFGMHYTQDESYYMLDAKEGAFVYLGLRDDINPQEMISDLKDAQQAGSDFDAEKHVAKWFIKKHDHVSIPAGTVHCSGANSMVLEISATPYIFTFKLWDWGRLGLDGKPRPINIEHGEKNIQWNRTASWVEKHALNLVEPLHNEEGIREERTGLSAMEFIETRRHWFTKKVLHNTHGTVNVLNLIEGSEAIVESPSNAFEPFVIHYAETFIVPAAVGEYTIRPHGESEGKECATIKAYVR
ncbi:MAG TPA: class I mannose-6-phosphate isomerase [Panacibacter sp.]|nr:class I mannose-6-phosphate isomerase [Panacibacter sp.]